MKKKAAWLAVAGACIALFANMGMNSVFTIFLSSFITEWPDASVATIALAATFGCAMAFVCSTFFVGPVLKKISPRVIFLICGALAVIYCGLYYIASAVWMLIVAGLFGGIVLSFGVHAMGVAAITPYFADFGKKIGAVIGVVLASAALGAAAFSFIPGFLIPVMGWRNVFLVIGAVVLFCDVLAFILIPKTVKAAEADSSAGSVQESEVPGLTMKAAIKTPSFWLTFAGVFCLTIMYQGLCTYMPTFLQVCGMSTEVASSMQGVMQLVGIIFILAGGALINKIGIKGLILFASLPLAAGCVLYAFAFPLSVSVPFAVVCSVLCVSGGVITNVCSGITPVLFGQKSMNQINSIYSGGAFWGGAAMASQVVGRVVTATESYPYGFVTAAVIGIIGTIILFVALKLNPMKKEKKLRNVFGRKK